MSPELHVGDLFRPPGSTVNLLEIAFPVRGADSTPLGAVRALLNAADLYTVLAPVRIGRTGYASLIRSNDGMVLASDDTDRILKAPLPGFEALHNAIEGFPLGQSGQELFGRSGLNRGYWTIPEVKSKSEAGREFVAEPARIVGYSPVDQVPDVNWLVTVEQERAEALAPVEGVTRYLWVHFIGVFATVILAALYFSFKLERPVMDEGLHLHEEHMPAGMKKPRGAEKDGLRELPEHEALQVVRLRNAEQDRVVTGLPALLDDRHRRAGVHRRGLEHRLEAVLVHVVRAGAGDEAAAGPQQLQRAEVDLVVAAHRLLDRVAALRERRRVEHDRVVALAGPLEPRSTSKTSRAAGRRGPASLLRSRSRAAAASAASEESTARPRSFSARGVQAPTSPWQQNRSSTRLPAARDSAHAAVQALVEEQAGLLPVQQVGLDRKLQLGTSTRSRHLAPPGRRARGGPAPRACAAASPATRTTAARLEDLLERLAHQVLAHLHAEREHLHREVVAVAVDDQRGEPVALAVDEAVRLCARGRRAAPVERALDPGAPEAVGQHLAPLDHAEADLGPARPQGVAEAVSPRDEADAHDRALGLAPPSFATSERKTHGCPRSMRACPLRLTTTGPSTCIRGSAYAPRRPTGAVSGERERACHPPAADPAMAYGDGAMGDGADGGAGPPSAGP